MPDFAVGDRVRIKEGYSFCPIEGVACTVYDDPVAYVVEVTHEGGVVRRWHCAADMLEPLDQPRIATQPAPKVVLCPSCGTSGAYVGFLTIECLNQSCRHYVAPKPGAPLAR